MEGGKGVIEHMFVAQLIIISALDHQEGFLGNKYTV